MRSFVAVALAGLACSVWGEPSLPETPAIQENQTQDQATPLPEKDRRKSEPLKIVNADKSSKLGDVTTWEGNVIIEYKGYTLRAQKIEGNLNLNTFMLSGGAQLQGEGDIVEGEAISVNFNDDTYSFRGGKGVVRPSRTQGLTTGEFFVSAGSGRLKSEHYHIADGVVTPCNQEHPHFTFNVGKGDVIPKRKMVLKDVELDILGKTVLKIPSLVIPLLDDRPKYLPEFGQSPDEGYYVKSRYTTLLGGEDTFQTRLDYMTKLGTGLGGEWNYESSNTLGQLGVYGIIGQNNSLLANFKHDQKFGQSQLTIDSAWQRNNYLTAPESTLFNGRGQLAIPSRRGQTVLGFSRNVSKTGTFGATNDIFSLTDNQSWGGGFRTSFNATYGDSRSQSNGSTLSSNERLDLRFSGTQELKTLSAELLYQRSIPVGGSQSFSSGSDRTPMLTLSSDSRRLIGGKFGQSWPFQTQFSIGEFQDPNNLGPITRMNFDFKGGRTDKLSPSTTLAWNAGFVQGIYSDDTAQYVVNYGANLNFRIGSKSTISANYRFLRSFGFTPLAVDLTGRNDSSQISINYDLGKGWGATAQTGYDVLASSRGRTPWQVVSLGTTYRSKDTSFQLASVYDTFQRTWGSIRGESRFKVGGTSVAAAARFDGQRSVWSGASLQVQTLKIGQFTSDFLLSYNGYTKQLEAQQYSIAYDLHCTEAVLEITDFRSGFRSGRQIAFYIRIKALPFGNDFGLGRRGQSVGGAGGFGF